MEQQQSCDVAGTDDLASPPLSQEDQPSSQSNVEDMNISIASLAINDDSEDTKEGEQQCEDQQQQQQPHDDNVGDTSITDAEVGDNNRNNETGTTTTIAAVSPVKSDAESVAATVQNILSTIIESAETVARDTLNNSNTTMEDFVDHIVVEDSGNNNSACNNNNNNSNNNSAESVALPTEENVKGEGGAEAVEGLEKLVSLFQDGGDWSNRLEGLQQLQSMVMNPKYNNEAVRYIVTRVNSLLASQLGDPRSSIVREACQSLTCFSRQLGKDYQKYTLQVVPGLLRLHTSTIAAISATSQECLESILQQSGVSAHCHLHFLNFAETVCAPQRIPSTVTDVVANNKALKLKALAYIKELLVAQRETEVQTSTIDQQPFEDAVANIIQMNSEAPPTDHTANDVKLAATEIMKMITPTEKKPALGKSPAAVRTPTSAKKASTKPTLDKKSPTAGKSPSLIKKSTPTSAKLVSESARSPASPMPEGDSPSKKRRLLSTPVKPSHNAVVVDNHAGLASPSAPPTAKSRKMDSSPRNSPSNNNTNGQSPRGVKPPSPRFSQGAAPAKQTLTHSSASPKLSSTNKVGSTEKKTPHKSPLTSSSPAAVAAQFTSPIKNFELLDNNKIAFDFTSNSDASGVIVALANVEHTVDSDVATSATNCDHSNGSINDDNNRGSETEERNQHPAMPTTTIGSIAITTDNNDNLAAGAQSAPESGSSHASKAPELPQKMMQSVETTTNDRKQEAQTTAAAEEATMISSTTTANNSDTVMDMVVEAQSQPPHQQEQPSSPPKPTVNNPVPTPAGPTDNNQLELLVAAQTAPMIMTSNNNDAATNAAVAAVTTAIMSCSPQNRAQQTSVIYKYTEEDLEKAKKAATQQALDEMDVINAQLEEMERLYNREQKERLALQATLAKYEELLLQQMQQQQQQQQHAAGVFTEEQYNTLLNVCKQHESSLNALQASYNELKDTYTRAQDENAQLNKKLDQAEQNYTKLKEFANKKLEETNSKASRLQQSIAQKDEQIKNLQELQHTVLPARDAEILRLRELVAKLEASNATTSNQLRSAEAREREHLSRIRALEDAAARKLEEEKQMLKRIEMETALRERELMAAKHQNSALSSQVFSKSAEIQLLQKKLAEATSNSPRTSSENDPTTQQQQQQQQMNEMNEKYAKAQAEIRALQQELADKKREVAELFQMCQSLLDELDKRNNNTNNTNNINPSVTNNNNNNNTQTPN